MFCFHGLNVVAVSVSVCLLSRHPDTLPMHSSLKRHTCTPGATHVPNSLCQGGTAHKSWQPCIKGDKNFNTSRMTLFMRNLTMNTNDKLIRVICSKCYTLHLGSTKQMIKLMICGLEQQFKHCECY